MDDTTAIHFPIVVLAFNELVLTSWNLRRHDSTKSELYEGYKTTCRSTVMSGI